MKGKNMFSTLVFFIIFGLGLAVVFVIRTDSNIAECTLIGVTTFIVAALISSSIRIADPWDKAVVLRLGKFHSLKGPGLFFIIPILDTIPPL